MASRQLVEELNKHKVDVSKLRTKLNELDKEKELWFNKKKELSEKIKNSIQEIRDKKSKRDSLTGDVKGLKAKRDSINNSISEKLKELGKLKKEKRDLAGALGIKESSSIIKQNIEKLEFMIETEPMPFDKEQKIMKKINGFKKLYNDSQVIVEIDKKIKNSLDWIKTTREESNETHSLIQEKAKQSQVLHEEVLKISVQIDKLKIEEEGAFKKFLEFKKQFIENDTQLKEELKEINNVKGQLDKIDFEKREKRRQEQELLLKSKEEAVNEKIKRGEKLTTEDLLVFQKLDSNK